MTRGGRVRLGIRPVFMHQRPDGPVGGENGSPVAEARSEGLARTAAELDALIEARFHDHPHTTVIRSMPGMGPMLGAEFIAGTGGD
jgi:transposase